ncbi:TPMT family class I SAM-dependent methyltransferase [Flavobacteriales bacterium]|nr:TPMT family class I SAM-dependent methyltransferase [Flavobacteriales bacterium]
MKLNLSSEYWNQRYQKTETGWDVGDITTPIKEYIDQLKDKNIRVLLPGAGNAHEAEYLCKNGFDDVVVVDFASIALDNLNERVPDFPLENLIQSNFFHHHGQYDLVIEQTFFCALNPQLRAEYAKHMHTLLKPEGKLVGLMFEAPLNTDHPPFGGDRQEYETYFNPFFKGTMKPCYNSIEPRAGKEIWINLKKK